MGKGKQADKQQPEEAVVDDRTEQEKATDIEIEHTKNAIEFQTKSLDRLKTIRTGKRKILDIFRQSGEHLDKNLMEQLHQRYNEFVCQESEILELLRRTMGLNKDEADNETNAAVNDLCAQIAETNAKLSQAKQKNNKLEREAEKRKVNVKEVEEQRDALANRVKNIQEENVQKKQTVLKLLSVLRENPEILDKTEKAGNSEPGFSCIEAAQSTPGTSKEYEEISKHIESIKARRGRMNAIRERLSQASQVQAAHKMDDTYQSALKRLDALSTIRKTLEESTAKTAEFDQEEENQKNQSQPKVPVETKPPLTSTTSVQLVTDSDDEDEDEEEDGDGDVEEVDKLLLDEVRKEFFSRLQNTQSYPNSFITTNHPPSPQPPPQISYPNIITTQCNCNCSEMVSNLERIEEQISIQNHRITALYDQINLLISLIAGNERVQQQHRRSTSYENNGEEFKHTLLSAPPETLHELSGILSDLASGDASSVKNLNSLFKHLGCNTTSSNASSKREESKEPVDETKRVAAISELNSTRGKLQKQRTLERVKIFATSGSTSFDKNVAEEEIDSNGVEKEICLIIEHVVPWLNKHENEKVETKLVNELRELIIGQANKICFPAGVNSDLFKTQLTTILDDAILQFSDDTFKKSHNAIVSEVSEILYNELTFFKLINNIDSMGVDED